MKQLIVGLVLTLIIWSKKCLIKHESKSTIETGVESIIELTDAEVAQMEADAAAYAVVEAERTAAAEALVALKASARAKLVAGTPLTEAEAATLVI